MTFTKFDKEKRKEILEHLRNGMSKSAACSVAGISPSKFYGYLKTHSRYAEEVEAAVQYAIGKAEAALFQAALKGNTTALQVFLYNKSPEEWKDRRAVTFAGNLKIANITDEEIEERLKMLINEITNEAEN